MRISDWSSDGVLFRSPCETNPMAVAGLTIEQPTPSVTRLQWVMAYCVSTTRSRFTPASSKMRSTRRRVRSPCMSDMKGSPARRSEEHTSELQSLMRISYAVFCLKNKHRTHRPTQTHTEPRKKQVLTTHKQNK